MSITTAPGKTSAFFGTEAFPPRLSGADSALGGDIFGAWQKGERGKEGEGKARGGKGG
jgi:hypothetical protein